LSSLSLHDALPIFEGRIVRAGHPRRRAAARPRIAFPGLVSRFAAAGDRVEAPRALPRRRLVRVDETANAELTAGDADDDFVFDDERRAREAVALVGISGSDIPTHTAGLRIEADDVCVERSHEQAVAQRRQAAVLRTAAERHLLRQISLVVPERTAGANVDRVRMIL